MPRKRITDVERGIMKDIALNLSNILKKKGISQKKLSEMTGISTSAISDYINAKTLMTPSIIQTVADALNVEAKEISESLTPVDTGGYERKGIPLVGTICAGNGLLASQNIEEYVQYPFPNKRQPDFALRVKGDSMVNAGIDDGDIVYIKATSWPDHNGQIVAVVTNDSNEGMLKRLRWFEGSSKMSLIPENDKYDVQELNPNEFAVCGVYMGHFKPYFE
ncbi:LexA family protein [Staphylococcus warneri]|uniref:LexA family protein n=1 Tax=Staphylococcus warneri TaxID=1292 RepID=UPI003BA0C9C9